jgi:hypothetical protein
VPQLAAGFDCTRAHLLQRDFDLEDWRGREADLPFEIPYRVGDAERWALVLVLLEHQSDTDSLMPLRLLLTAVLYWEKQWAQWKNRPTPRPPLRLRPVLPLVIYTADRPWGSTRTLAELLDEPTGFHTFAPVWQPLFWNLADLDSQALLASGEAWLQALAVLRVEGAEAVEFAAIYREAVACLRNLQDRDEVRWYDLMRIVLTWAAWRRPAQEWPSLHAVVTASAELKRKVEIEAMTHKLGPTIADNAILGSKREDLRLLLVDRFGELPEEVGQRISVCMDAGRLQQAIRQVNRMQSLADLSL